MENNEKLYLGTNGKYYQEHELHMAYFLATGNDILADETGRYTKQFEIWVYDLIGLSIKKVVNIDDVSYEDFLRADQKLLAVREYRNRNHCTLRDAKEAIDKILESIGSEVNI